MLVKRTVLKQRSKKTDSERRVTETVFAKVCLPLIRVIIFRIMLVSFIYSFFNERKIGTFALIKVQVKILAAEIKAFQSAFEVKRHVPTA